jgi:hypothetical protein
MPKLIAPRKTVSGPADDRTCLSQGMGDKGTVEAFRAHLLAVHVNPLTGKSLSRRVASNTISRLRRIERTVGRPIQLADIDDVLSRLKGFPDEGNAKTALRHWRAFLGGEPVASADTSMEDFRAFLVNECVLPRTGRTMTKGRASRIISLLHSFERLLGHLLTDDVGEEDAVSIKGHAYHSDIKRALRLYRQFLDARTASEDGGHRTTT